MYVGTARNCPPKSFSETIGPEGALPPPTLNDVLQRLASMRAYAGDIAGRSAAVRRTLCEYSGSSAEVRDMGGPIESAQVSQGLIQDIISHLDGLQYALDSASNEIAATQASLG